MLHILIPAQKGSSITLPIAPQLLRPTLLQIIIFGLQRAAGPYSWVTNCLATSPEARRKYPPKPSRRSSIGAAVEGESPGGISPPGAPKTVREPLGSHGFRCSTVGTRAAGFTSSTGSSCCQLASVGRWSRLNNAAPSVQLHYRTFAPTTSCSAPVLRIGTLVLAVLTACDFSLCIGAQVPTFRTKAWLSFAPPPCRMPLGPSQASPKLIPEEWQPPGFDIV